MDLLQIIAFILPAYIANAVPTLFKGRTPLDLHQKFLDKERVFGSGKTVRGLIAGVVGGTLTGYLLALYLPNLFIPSLALNDKIFISFLLSVGTLFGDLIGSFIKRRIGIKSGQQALFMDQLLFIITALLLAFIAYPSSLLKLFDAFSIMFILIATFFIHIAVNIIAHKLGLKSVPW